jgi:hypothetical protein
MPSHRPAAFAAAPARGEPEPLENLPANTGKWRMGKEANTLPFRVNTAGLLCQSQWIAFQKEYGCSIGGLWRPVDCA